MRKFVEVYFDAENVPLGAPIGSIKRGLWAVVCWDLDKNNEPIIESGIVLVEKSSLVDCQHQAKIYADDLKSHGFKVYVSGNSPDSMFKIKSAEYETFIYNRRLL
ncbi:hypothetical protein LCGC14_1227860 [marine sediment metagenome]|uniref:Uncharacterized protein n=1 Tax=marine sediment metagenome TaxID=412755 RepID=A0A0F9PDQ3_9ZZZZ|nr:hypothetical protein [Candidatus Scalindua sp.]